MSVFPLGINQIQPASKSPSGKARIAVNTSHLLQQLENCNYK